MPFCSEWVSRKQEPFTSALVRVTGWQRTRVTGDNGRMNNGDLPPEFPRALDELWDQCVGMIARGIDYPHYVNALSVMYARDDVFSWPVALAVARSVWRQTPQPALNYGLPPLPTTERNAACPCGSGQKYKKCCLALEHDLPMGQVNFLPVLLEYLQRRRWSELAGSRIAPDMVAHAAMELNAGGFAKEACTLLEPWFVADADFHAGREVLFDALLDAYGQLQRPRKKAQLLARAIEVGDRRLRSAALQRQASIASDNDDHAGAWRCFAEAQRSDPQSPSLSHLEVTLLMSEGRHAEARERARFWAHRLAAMRDPELEHLVAFMRNIVTHGEQGMQQMALDNQPDLRELSDLLQTAPAIASAYTLEPSDEEAGPLEPTRAMAKALHAWEQHAGSNSHSPVFGGGGGGAGIALWLPELRQQPQLWNAFEVLDTIVAAIDELNMGMLTVNLARSVLDRAEQLLREVLRANHAEGKRLEWGWLQNRPALNLIGQRIAIDAGQTPDAAQVARLEWLVCELNPNDNQGFRHALVRAYLHTGRVADALALTERYPDDFAAMQYNRALALFAAGQSDAAVGALGNAVAAHPKPAAWLLKANPKPPRQDGWGIAVGGDEEAWIYRQETLALWQQLEAMAWLRQVMRALGKKR
jgi:tetratricopeptide (TPR) repeat protein